MDNFTELLIERSKTANHRLIQVVTWSLVAVCTVLVSYILLRISFFMLFLTPIFLFFMVYANINLLNMMNIEFEYTLVNNYFDVDKIVGARNRERMISLKMNDIVELGRFNKQPINREKYTRTITPVSNLNAENLWYFVAEDDESNSYFVVFEPNDRILNHMKKFVSRRATNGALDEF